MTQSTLEMLAEYARLLNDHGHDSGEAREFLESRTFDSEFVELATLSRKLKEALVTPNSRAHA